MTPLDEKRAEFKQHLWDHSVDEFQMQFDVRRELSSEEVAFLTDVQTWIIIPDDSTALTLLRSALVGCAPKLALLLQVCGLTRSKILSDLKASRSHGKNVKLPASYHGLSSPSAWSLAGPYLLKRLRAVMGHLDRSHLSLGHVFEAMNQSTWPGYIRQERAKRSGHEAEYRLATLLFSLGIPFEPTEKADNPLCRDAQIDGISFDLVVPSARQPAVVIKSTVHTSNIGQYGESKDHLEIDEARRWLDAHYADDKRPTLLAFIDGVGFHSNSAGLNGLLEKADEFCQFKTVWKAVIIAAQSTGRRVEVALSEEDITGFAGFIDRWNAKKSVTAISQISSTLGWIKAGDALITQRGP